MDGGSLFRAIRPRLKKKSNRKQKNKAWLKYRGLNEHHRQPRCRQGGRGHGDLNIVKVGIQIHRCFHTIFDARPPVGVVAKINQCFENESEYLVIVPTKFFSTFHSYFTNRQVLKLIGMAGYGLTWGHLFLYGTQDDLRGVFRVGRHHLSKPDLLGDPTDRWGYLFHRLTMSVMAYELTRYWLPLDSVVIAVPKQHRVEVDSFLSNLSVQKKRR